MLTDGVGGYVLQVGCETEETEKWRSEWGVESIPRQERVVIGVEGE